MYNNTVGLHVCAHYIKTFSFPLGVESTARVMLLYDVVIFCLFLFRPLTFPTAVASTTGNVRACPLPPHPRGSWTTKSDHGLRAEVVISPSAKAWEHKRIKRVYGFLFRPTESTKVFCLHFVNSSNFWYVPVYIDLQSLS